MKVQVALFGTLESTAEMDDMRNTLTDWLRKTAVTKIHSVTTTVISRGRLLVIIFYDEVPEG